MNEYKSVEKYLNKQKGKKTSEDQFRSRFLNFCNRALVSGILLLSVLCIIKMHPESKKEVYKFIYSQNFSFAPFQEWYQKYFGNLFPEEFSPKLPKDQMVFQESFVYQEKKEIENGVRVSVGKGYLMPSLESGLVVFMGNKDGYGETLIIQQMNGVDAWYVGLTPTDLKLYDYVEKGSLLGEVKEKDLDLYFQKEGEFVDYKEYIS
ncbi:MAG: M23 family metallopeptidase [Bacilli bacterium]|nr:M23 family metallopeptidase [Bacilli bacterium]